MRTIVRVSKKIGNNLLIVILVVLLGLMPLVGRVRAASAPSQWVGDLGTQVSVVNGDTLTSSIFNALYQSKFSVFGSLSCAQHTLPTGPEEFDDWAISHCWYPTSIGKVSRVGYAVHPNGYPYAGWREGYSTELFPTMNKDVFVEIALDNEYESDGKSDHMMFRKAEDAQLIIAPQEFEYPTYYKWASPPTATLLGSDGNPYPIDGDLLYSNVWYSENGQWMVIWMDEGYFIRINLNDFSVLTAFAGASGYASGSITNDGRHIAINVFGTPLRILDLEFCSQPPTTYVTEPVHCPIQFFTPQLEAAGVYSGYGTLPIFHDENRLRFYVGAPDGYREYILLTSAASTRTNYIAMGDSFASGEGAGNYYQSTDNDDPENYCHLSRISYPFRLGTNLNLDDTHSVACSGARIKNIIGPEIIDDNLSDERRTNQFSRVENDPELRPVPGYSLQSKILSENNVDIITLSIGGNDIGFSDIIQNCVYWSTCFTSVQERKALVNLINRQFDRLVKTYEDIKKTATLGSRIYVIGYPEIVKPGGNCGANVRLNSQETYFASNLTRYLNEIIQRASERAGVVYVDVSTALDGRRLCESDDPAVHGLNTARRRPPVSPESYHPNGAGQDLISEAINTITAGLTASMPRANKSIVAPVDYSLAVSYGLLTIDEVGYSSDGVIDYAYPPNQNIAIRGQRFSGSTASASYGLAPNQSYELSMTSDPVYLGTYSSNEDGVVFYDVEIPAETPAGLHTLHLKGLSTEGQPIDVRQNLYVAASEEDWDGDGIPNQDSPCQIALPNETTGEADYNWCENPSSPLADDPGNEDSEQPPNDDSPGQNHPTPILNFLSSLIGKLYNVIKVIVVTILWNLFGQ